MNFTCRVTYPVHFLWINVLSAIGWLFVIIFGRHYKQSIYGKTIRKSQFLLDDKVAPLNHGGYGALPRAVTKVQRSFQVLICFVNNNVGSSFTF